jgi:hypothetical protein
MTSEPSLLNGIKVVRVPLLFPLSHGKLIHILL